MNLKEMASSLENVLEETRGNLVRSTGGQSVCSIHKHGNPSDFMKYNEGKEFIVRKTIRLLNGEATEAELLSYLSEQGAKFDRYKSSESVASAEWQAYADGGLDGIELVKGVLGIQGVDE